jgi:hypothetical protein
MWIWVDAAVVEIQPPASLRGPPDGHEPAGIRQPV